MKRLCLIGIFVAAVVLVVGFSFLLVGVGANILTPEAMLVVYGVAMMFVGFILLIIFDVGYIMFGRAERKKERQAWQAACEARRRQYRSRTRGEIHHH